MRDLPPYASRKLVGERLPLIFPDGTPNRLYCVRGLAASTVFTMLYIGAVEGSEVYLAPKHVYRMTEKQAVKDSALARQGYSRAVLRPGFAVPGTSWYADNTRESIRDETLREGLVEVGAAIARDDLPTTSSKPRYALKTDFVNLFDPELDGELLERAVAGWQATNLSKGSLSRIKIMRLGAAGGGAGVLVTFPNGETRQLVPGPSSVIAQAVIEVFSKHFLYKPAVLWLSESGNKVLARDDKLAAAIGLKIEIDRNLPDLILADLGPSEPIIVFVEVVATDGAITPRRQRALLALTDEAGFKRSQIAFLTAYQDRQSAGFRKTISNLAWNSFAWFVSEPRNIITLRDGNTVPVRLSELIGDG